MQKHHATDQWAGDLLAHRGYLEPHQQQIAVPNSVEFRAASPAVFTSPAASPPRGSSELASKGSSAHMQPNLINPSRASVPDVQGLLAIQHMDATTSASKKPVTGPMLERVSDFIPIRLRLTALACCIQRCIYPDCTKPNCDMIHMALRTNPTPIGGPIGQSA